MARLQEITTDDLRDVLAETERKVPAQRVAIGIHYKEGVSQTTLAERYGVHRNTIGNWLDRLEQLIDEPSEQVVRDADRPGRPSKLTDEQHERLEETLRGPPTESGIDAPAWTPELVKQHIADEFVVEYHVRHVRRLMDDIEPSHETV